MSHTPGPWRVFQRTSEVGTGYWRLAPIDDGDIMHGYCGEANARLIAAAPDLEEVVVEMMQMLKERAADRRLYPGEEVLLEMGQKALAKARGEA